MHIVKGRTGWLIMAHSRRTINAYNKGLKLINEGLLKEAIKQFDQCISLEPDHRHALRQRAFTYNLLGEWQPALNDCELALTVDDHDAWSYMYRASIYFGLKQFTRVIDDCSKAIGLDSSISVAYTQRGSAYCELKELVKAVWDFDKAIELNPVDPANFICRAVVYDQSAQIQKDNR